MTDDLSALDNLRPEVICALDALYNYRFSNGGFYAACKVIRAELLRLADECSELHKAAARGALAHMKTQAELAALKARIAEAPMAVVQSAPGAIKASFHGYGCFEYTAENLQPRMRGKRVRLLVEE